MSMIKSWRRGFILKLCYLRPVGSENLGFVKTVEFWATWMHEKSTDTRFFALSAFSILLDVEIRETGRYSSAFDFKKGNG